MLKERVYFQIMQISSFYNHSWAENWFSSWLGELQIDRWDSELNTLVFLQSWSRDSLSHKELVDMQTSLHAHFIRFTEETQTFAHKLQLECELNFLRGGHVLLVLLFLRQLTFSFLDIARFSLD